MQLPKAQTLSLSLGRALPRILSPQAFDESGRQGRAALICPYLPAHPGRAFNTSVAVLFLWNCDDKEVVGKQAPYYRMETIHCDLYTRRQSSLLRKFPTFFQQCFLLYVFAMFYFCRKSLNVKFKQSKHKIMHKLNDIKRCTMMKLLLFMFVLTLTTRAFAQENVVPEILYQTEDAIIDGTAVKDGHVFVGYDHYNSMSGGLGYGKLYKVGSDGIVTEREFLPKEDAWVSSVRIIQDGDNVVAVYLAKSEMTEIYMSRFDENLNEIDGPILVKVIEQKSGHSYKVYDLYRNDDGTFAFGLTDYDNNSYSHIEYDIIKLSSSGDILAECPLSSEHGSPNTLHSMILQPDALGYYYIGVMYTGNRQYLLTALDNDLNIISEPEVVTMQYAPDMLGCFNGPDGNIYGLAMVVWPAFNGNPRHNGDLTIYKMDAGMHQIAYKVADSNGDKDLVDWPAMSQALCFPDEETILSVGTLDVSTGLGLQYPCWGLYIGRSTLNLNILNEVYYIDELYAMDTYGVYACQDGGCLVVANLRERNSGNDNKYEFAILKFPAEAFLGVEEAHTNGLKVAIAYPNPGHDVLNIRTALPDARVEVYDANGRIVHSQDITENVTSIDAGEWSEGVYVWKVICNDKLAETGKWIKE